MNRSSPVLFWGPPILYAAIIFWLSSLSTVPSTPLNSDKILHFLEYFLLAGLLYRALGGGSLRVSKFKMALVLLICTLYAASDEVHQSFVPGRTASVYDWLADVAGILGMLTLMVIAVKWRGKAFKYDPI